MAKHQQDGPLIGTSGGSDTGQRQPDLKDFKMPSISDIQKQTEQKLEAAKQRREQEREHKQEQSQKR